MNDMPARMTDETALDEVAVAPAGGASRRTVLRGLAATLLAGPASAGDFQVKGDAKINGAAIKIAIAILLIENEDIRI